MCDVYDMYGGNLVPSPIGWPPTLKMMAASNWFGLSLTLVNRLCEIYACRRSNLDQLWSISKRLFT